MRIRLPFAGAFVFLAATAGYAGLSSLQLDAIVNDKILHCVTFFVLTTCFYWILDTSRRRNLNLTLLICTGILGVGSEFLQGFLPNGRQFDFYDIVANVVGSLAALGLSSWYHLRMLERKRLAKNYQAVPGEEDADLELGEGVGIGAQESGTTSAGAPASHNQSLDQELDNWDENIEDGWEEDEHLDSAEGEGLKTPSASSAGEDLGESKKRAD
ncbi:VanZ like family protein [Mollisia scopiformis]|uniref:VanZ like family protein n=1 Tax=Mollisia scopiformis TaxID=149040 RepID=A0A194X384_MOLSC|nr:VanZ like family protein [Mollisia scopiformis]KUJ14660.1 VanZ like family protein [Mollisia scopiformis]